MYSYRPALQYMLAVGNLAIDAAHDVGGHAGFGTRAVIVLAAEMRSLRRTSVIHFNNVPQVHLASCYSALEFFVNRKSLKFCSHPGFLRTRADPIRRKREKRVCAAGLISWYPNTYQQSRSVAYMELFMPTYLFALPPSQIPGIPLLKRGSTFQGARIMWKVTRCWSMPAWVHTSVGPSCADFPSDIAVLFFLLTSRTSQIILGAFFDMEARTLDTVLACFLVSPTPSSRHAP
jgi:hypothetical protein